MAENVEEAEDQIHQRHQQGIQHTLLPHWSIRQPMGAEPQCKQCESI